MKRFIPFLILMSLWITEAVAHNFGAPTGVTVTPGDRQVTFRWTHPSGIDLTDVNNIAYEFRVNSRDIVLEWGRSTPSVVSENPSYTWAGSFNGTEYTYDIRFFHYHTEGNQQHHTPWSTPIKVTPRMPAPTDFTGAAIGNRTVTLSWTAPSPLVASITGYEYSQNGGPWIPTGSTSTSHTVTGLENGVSYAFRVRAVRAGATDERNGLASRTVTVTPLRDAPGAPGTLNVQRVEDTATLTWSPPSNPEAIIRYEYSDDSGATWQSTGSTDTTYTVTGLEPGETYTFLVRAVYVDGTTSRIISLPSQSSNAAVLTFPKPKRRILLECPVGWQRTDRFAQPNPRVLLYEVKLKMDLQNLVSIYKPDWVAIYVHPDEALENLDGWKLKVAVPYNLHRDYLLTAENSVVVDANIEGVEGGFAFIKSPEEAPFPMIGMGFTGATVPGFDYRLYDDTGRKVDFGIACYKRGDIFQALKEMEDPRVLRNVLLESLDWDATTYIRSEWTVPVTAPAAPSLVKKTVVGTWAALKKR